MSDIPIGSPPAPPGRHAAPGGWYVDPVDPAQERYWDGWQWSRNTRPRGAVQPTAQRPYATDPQNPYAPAGYRPAPGARSTQAATTADGVPLATWGWRLLAVILDTVVSSVLVQIATAPFASRLSAPVQAWVDKMLAASQSGAPPSLTTLFADFPVREQLVSLLIGLVVITAYHLAFLRWRAATPGKLVCGLRVVPLDQGRHLGPLSWSTIGIRVAIWAVAGQIGLFRLLDGLLPLWQPRRQALHDLAAKTQVIRTR